MSGNFMPTHPCSLSKFQSRRPGGVRENHLVCRVLSSLSAGERKLEPSSSSKWVQKYLPMPKDAKRSLGSFYFQMVLWSCLIASWQPMSSDWFGQKRCRRSLVRNRAFSFLNEQMWRLLPNGAAVFFLVSLSSHKNGVPMGTSSKRPTQPLTF